ncbi:MAG: AI-2E family transporter [Actinomycetota bacterium]|nr:AI-2E family transporter [Actinomycetota bacterium]
MQDTRPVPVKTILATIGLVLLTLLHIWLIIQLAHVLTLLVIAAFFAVVLTQPVNFFRKHLHLSRGLATAFVYILGIALLGGMLYVVIRPLVAETRTFIDDFPRYVSDAQAGKGPLGKLVQRYELDRRLEENKDNIQRWAQRAGGGAFDIARKVFNGVVALLTVLVLSILMILYGPELLRGGVGILSPPNQTRVSAVAGDCARALTGYVMGNFLISICAAVVTYVALWAFGVPFKEVLALWVGFADLIPLVGATLGAIPTIGIAFLHSTTAGIGMLIVYIVYQQFENHVLQVTIMSKTVKINQLFVLVSVLIGVELFGLLGALLAIPAAGVIQVIARDVWDHRKGRLKEEPTIGEEEVPVSEMEHPPDLPEPEHEKVGRGDGSGDGTSPSDRDGGEKASDGTDTVPAHPGSPPSGPPGAGG